ncbi:MAG: EAL domain-containing protein [Burkholderiales bacterium]|nr:EAL domain-containing protein [Burkholderiales bacterium]
MLDLVIRPKSLRVTRGRAMLAALAAAALFMVPVGIHLMRVNVPASGVPVTWPELIYMLAGGLLIAVLVYKNLHGPVALRAEFSEGSHALLNSIFDHIPGMIVIRNVNDGKIVWVNSKAASVLGCPKEDLIGRHNNDIFPADQANRLSVADKTAVDSGQMVHLPDERVQTGGATHWIDLKKLAVPATGTTPGYVLELGEDISDRKHLDTALAQHTHFVDQLLAAMPSPVFFKSEDGRYLGVNKAFEAFYGVTPEQMVGKTVYDIAPPDLARIYDDADRALLASGGAQIYESQVTRKTGETKDVIFNKAVFSNPNGDVAGIVGVILDITERKAAERHVLQLNRALAVLNETNEAIARCRDRRSLFEKSVQILHGVGEFWLSWIDSTSDDLSDVIGSGKRPDLVAKLNVAVRERLMQPSTALGDLASSLHWDATFVTALAEMCPDLVASDPALAHLGLAHLPIRTSGKLSGAICILASSDEIGDKRIQRLLAALADNLTYAADALVHQHARELAERKLQLTSHVFDNSTEGVMVTDANNMILLVNRRFSEITGYTAEEVIGHSPKMLSSGQQDASFYANMWRSLRNRGEWHGEIRNRRKNGETIVEWMNISAVKTDEGKYSNFVAVFSEMTVHKKVKKRMQYLAHYDVLTGLPNRILFSDRLEQSIISAKRNQRMAALLLVDIDRFDDINQQHGHAAGDIVLQEVAQRLLGAVPEGCSVSRLGSDEFAVILPDVAAFEDIASRAERAMQMVGRTVHLSDAELRVSASIGIGIYPKDGADSDAIIKSAEAAMYKSAEAGGGTFRFHNPHNNHSNSVLSERMKLYDSLHRAMERNELGVYYQPIVSSATGRIIGAEALLRWFRPESGFVSPQAFMPMLEESGLVVKVGDWVLHTALADSAAWRSGRNADIVVAVNLSKVQFNDERCVEHVREALQAQGISARCLQLEVSESSVMADAPAGLAVMHRLKELGVRLVIDNFGTSYSSLSYLHRFPISAIKIDRSFVMDTPADPEAVAVTQAVVAMGHALQIQIVAEGVETQQQIAYLREIGCDAFQGYRFSQAVSAAEFAKLLQRESGFDSLMGSGDMNPRLKLVSANAA